MHLVDGGLHDNQGVYGLLEQDCRLLLVSDASGQKDVTEKRRWHPWNVLLRSNTVSMGVIRKEFYRELDGRQRSSRLKALWYLHLGTGLDEPAADVFGAPDPPAEVPDGNHAGELTSYGMPKDIQARLALLRTDLDVFTEDEADALMLSGYRMTKWRLEEPWHPLVADRGGSWMDWRFRRMEPLLALPPDHPEHRRLLIELDAGRHRWFRRTYRVRGRYQDRRRETG